MATIGTNVGALNASFYLNQNSNALNKNIKRLSSGSRLADPTDDAAGVAVSGKLDATSKRLGAAADGANTVISYAQTADGFMSTIQQQLTRMSELAERSTNGAYGTADLANYAAEFNNLKSQIQNIITDSKFNGTAIFNGSAISTAINAEGVTDSIAAIDLSTSSGAGGLGISTLLVTSTASAGAAVTAINTAIETLTTQRASTNADIAKFNFHVQNIQTENTNIDTANGRIKDLDIATESTQLSKNNVLLQAATSMLAQANSSQQAVLSLLK